MLGKLQRGIRENSGFFLLDIFNSGYGLSDYHLCRNFPKSQFQTVKRFRIPEKELTYDLIQDLVSVEGSTVDELYNKLEKIYGASSISTDDFPWQSAQKGKNCSFECIFAYLKFRLYEDYGKIEGQKKYDFLRKSLFEQMIEESLQPWQDHENKENLLPRYIAILKKKIEKKTQALYPTRLS